MSAKCVNAITVGEIKTSGFVTKKLRCKTFGWTTEMDRDSHRDIGGIVDSIPGKACRRRRSSRCP